MLATIIGYSPRLAWVAEARTMTARRLLGVELLHRTTHHVSLSTAGAALHERTRGHLTALRSAVVELPEREEAPSGLLRMTAAPDFGAIVLPSLIAAFSRRFPASPSV